MTDDRRQQALTALIQFNKAVPELEKMLRDISPESEQIYATLTRDHVIHVLQAYLQQDISFADLMYWVRAIYAREDIALEAGYAVVIEDVIHNVRIQIIATQTLSIDQAQQFIQTLSRAKMDTEEAL